LLINKGVNRDGYQKRLGGEGEGARGTGWEEKRGILRSEAEQEKSLVWSLCGDRWERGGDGTAQEQKQRRRIRFAQKGRR